MANRYSQIHQLITEGRAAEALTRLKNVRLKRATRAEALTLANCFRRMNQPERALAALDPWAGPEADKPRPEELAEYAASLMTLGSLDEAQALLDAVVERLPKARLFRAMCRVRAWDWKRALPDFEVFLATEPPDSLDIAASRMFVASCWMHGHGELEKGARLLEELLEQTSGDRRSIARMCLLLLAQGRFLARDREGAGAYLDRMQAMNLEDRSPFHELFLRKWRALVAMLGPERERAAARGELERARADLVRERHWERVRGIDYHLATSFGDREAGLRAWHGSRYSGIREKLAPLLSAAEREPARDWVFGDGRFSISARNGENDGPRGGFLKEGQLLQRLFESLCLDRYRPATLAELHERVYPGERFRVGSSALRIHQALWRLRRWLEREGVPLRIAESDGLFGIEAAGVGLAGCRIVLADVDRGASVRLRRAVEACRAKLGGEGRAATSAFTVQDAARALGVSRPTAFRLMKEAVCAGLLEASADSKAVSYRFTRTAD